MKAYMKIKISKAPPIIAKNRLEINYNNYVMNLFRLGFTIGNNDRNIPKILSAINGEKEKESFLAGTKVFDTLEGIKTEDIV